jgi:hypothetical protein
MKDEKARFDKPDADIWDYIRAAKDGHEVPSLIRKVFEAAHDFNHEDATLSSIQRDLSANEVKLSRKQIKAILELD